MSKELWQKNEIQFPRLICEIAATQDSLDMAAIAEAMDISSEELGELFERANVAWESAKGASVAAAPSRQTMTFLFHGHTLTRDVSGSVSCGTCSIPQAIYLAVNFMAEHNIQNLVVDGVAIERRI